MPGVSFVPIDREERLGAMYAAFNARDIEATLKQMTADVNWPNAWEGGRLHGREEVRGYWLRQLLAIEPTVEPVGFKLRADLRVAVEVDQVVRDGDGALLERQRVLHVHTFRDGLIARMDVEEMPECGGDVSTG